MKTFTKYRGQLYKYLVVFNSPDKVTELAGYKEMYNYLCEAVTWCRVSSVRAGRGEGNNGDIIDNQVTPPFVQTDSC